MLGGVVAVLIFTNGIAKRVRRLATIRPCQTLECTSRHIRRRTLSVTPAFRASRSPYVPYIARARHPNSPVEIGSHHHHIEGCPTRHDRSRTHGTDHNLDRGQHVGPPWTVQHADPPSTVWFELSSYTGATHSASPDVWASCSGCGPSLPLRVAYIAPS